MLFQFLLSAIGTFLKAVFSILPDLPPLPIWVSDSVDYMTNILVAGVSLIAYIFTTQIVVFVFATSLVLLNFTLIYHSIMWIVRKLPIGSS